ncbi:MAG TPA: hypothetical protein VGF69_21025 [Thermoanaerobaculia bacterium]|jgi:hypothetical protein
MSRARVLLVCLLITAACRRTAESPAPADGTTYGTDTTATTSTQPAAFPSIPAVVISGTIPTTVPIPANAPTDATPEQVRPYFDWFSWESFIALNWPASGAGRGNPDQPSTPSVFTSMTNTTPVTWGTYKANWELFDQYDKRPTPWNDYGVAYAPTVCPQAQPSDKQLLMVTKGDTELQDVNQAFSFPLVDQQNNFVYYEVRYNQPQYDWIRGADDQPSSWLYLSQNLPPGTVVSLPPNAQNTGDSIMLKAAWRNLTNVPAAQRQRFYTVNAWVYDSSTNQCTQQPMGLVGFHIAQKTKEFPEWIWSTFEQVDNVPPTNDNVPSSFNNGTDNPPTGTQGFANRPTYQAPGQLPSNPTPTQVSRLNPIPTTPAGASTVDVNNAFHAALPKNSVWQYYELVITQWPSNPARFKAPADRGVYPDDAGGAFPADGAVNTTLETYFQSQQLAVGAGGNSCMSCHFNAGNGQRDFSWGLTRRPHQDAPPPPNAKLKATAQTAAK